MHIRVPTWSVLLATCLIASAASFNPNDPKIYGMNLGGWLVLEPFITPGLFAYPKSVNPAVTDEWTFCEFYGNNTDVLTTHWNNWISEESIAFLNATGITHLRIPVGYWIVLTQEELTAHNEPFYTGGWDYLIRVLRWAKMYNMKVIIDLHAVPGSQNPWPHSGRQTQNPLWGTGDTLSRTYDVLDRLASRIAAMETDPSLNDTIIGLEVLNEAFPPMLQGGVDLVLRFYREAYPIVRRHLPADRYLYIIEEAFSAENNPNPFQGFMSDTSQYQNVVLDLHTYQCFDAGLRATSYEGHLSIACNQKMQKTVSQSLPTFTGEWSYAYKEDSDHAWQEAFPNQSEQRFMRHYGASQMEVFERGLGWFFWNFKTESAPMWDWQLGVVNGWIPCHFPDQQTQNACNNWETYWNVSTCNITVPQPSVEFPVTTGRPPTSTSSTSSTTSTTNPGTTSATVSTPSTTGSTTGQIVVPEPETNATDTSTTAQEPTQIIPEGSTTEMSPIQQFDSNASVMTSSTLLIGIAATIIL